MDKIEIVKIDRTDANVDNSRYEAKVAYEVKDDYGNVATLYRKEVIGNLSSLIEQKETLEKQLSELNDKIEEINKLNEPIKEIVNDASPSIE